MDDVTKNKVKDIGRLSVFTLEDALKLIKARQNPSERLALVAELENRFSEYGRMKGWVDGPRASKNDVDVLTRFIVEDALGLKNQSPREAIVGEFVDRVKAAISEGVNSRGKTWFSFLGFLHDFCMAETADDAKRVLMGVSLGGLGAWVGKNWNKLVHKLKWVKVPLKARARIIKYIGTALIWKDVAAARLARFNPWIVFISTLFESENIASDADEERLTFLLLYGKVLDQNQSALGDIVREISGPQWQFRVNPREAVRQLEIRAR